MMGKTICRYKILKKLGEVEILGKIHQEKSWKDTATEHYERFLTLWKDADPNIPEVEDARKRLAGLKNN